jgi:hypothetical protein
LRARKNREKTPVAMTARAFATSPVLILALLGCAAPAAAPASNVGVDPAAGRAPIGSGPQPTSAGEPGGSADGTTARAVPPSVPLPAGEEPTPDRALPELRIEPLGMHVGGGKNTPEEKAPFHHALEQKFPAFLECYRLVEEPWQGGSFGVDIKIPRAGGAATVEQPRTRIRGNGFQDCMLAAFQKVQFDKPKAGPTVLSYSVLFVLGKPKH